MRRVEAVLHRLDLGGMGDTCPKHVAITAVAVPRTLPLTNAIEALGVGGGGIGEYDVPAVAGSQRQGRPVRVRKRVPVFEGVGPSALGGERELELVITPN